MAGGRLISMELLRSLAPGRLPRNSKTRTDAPMMASSVSRVMRTHFIEGLRKIDVWQRHRIPRQPEERTRQAQRRCEEENKERRWRRTGMGCCAGRHGCQRRKKRSGRLD